MNLNLKTLKAILICFSVTAIISCKKGSGTVDPDPVKPVEKGIVSYSLSRADKSAFDADELNVRITSDSVVVLVPHFTDLKHLTPQIEIKGSTIVPASGIAQDFTAPVVYTVTGTDGTTKKYVVSVKPDKLKNMVTSVPTTRYFTHFTEEQGNLFGNLPQAALLLIRRLPWIKACYLPVTLIIICMR